MATTSGARLTQRLILFHPGVGPVEQIGHRGAGQNSSEESRQTRRKKKTETQRSGTPRRHAVRARNQVADAALKPTAAGFKDNGASDHHLAWAEFVLAPSTRP